MSNIEYDQKIRSKNLELTRALQDIDRLISDNVRLSDKLLERQAVIIDLEEKLEQLKNNYSIDK